MARLIALIGVVVTFTEGSSTASDESCSSEKLKIAVIGASPGTTRRLFMKMTLDAGHSVTAIARTLSKIEEKHGNLTVVQGDVKKLVEPIQGCDVVVGSFGHRAFSDTFKATTLYSDGTRGVTSTVDGYQSSRQCDTFGREAQSCYELDCSSIT